MSLGEFDLIDMFFRRPAGVGPQRAVVGNGDDCAVLAPSPGMQLAVSTDTLVEGRHFLSTVPPARLGHKALAVNLSDLAACGARPLAFTLALTLPRADEAWLRDFSRGLLALADAHDCELVGGDTTAGPLSITITVMGEVPAGQALLRGGARAGDDLWVSGFPGQARLALEGWRDALAVPLSPAQWSLARLAMEMPQPRVALGLALRGLATAAVDVSDGLLGDLGHVLGRSGVAAEVFPEAIALGEALLGRPTHEQRAFTLAGGDDYELVFTTPQALRADVQALARDLALPLSRFGRIVPGTGLRCLTGHPDGPAALCKPLPLPPDLSAFDHFRGAP